MAGHRLSPEAEAELDGIWLYIAERSSPQTADRFIDRLTETFFLLSEQPGIGRAREDLRPGYRGFPVGVYVVFYRVEGDDVLIMHVIHGRRDIDSLLRSEEE